LQEFSFDESAQVQQSGLKASSTFLGDSCILVLLAARAISKLTSGAPKMSAKFIAAVLMAVSSFAACAQSGTSLAAATPAVAATTAAAPVYEVFAIRYASIPDFPVNALVADADPGRKLSIAMAVWLIRGNGRNILVDSGFYRPQFFKEWKVDGKSGRLTASSSPLTPLPNPESLPP
jgi:hypothetical protein